MECVYCTIGEYATPTKKHMEKRKPKTARAKCQYDRIEWTTFFQSETLNQQLECVYCTTLISASNLAACGQTESAVEATYHLLKDLYPTLLSKRKIKQRTDIL